jgi:serine/threonine protein kinase
LQIVVSARGEPSRERLVHILDVLKIYDFGLATLFRSQTTREERKLTTYCGTAPYSSPKVMLTTFLGLRPPDIRWVFQVWAKTPYRGEPVDVWSCGIILTSHCDADRRYVLERNATLCLFDVRSSSYLGINRPIRIQSTSVGSIETMITIRGRRSTT